MGVFGGNPQNGNCSGKISEWRTRLYGTISQTPLCDDWKKYPALPQFKAISGLYFLTFPLLKIKEPYYSGTTMEKSLTNLLNYFKSR